MTLTWDAPATNTNGSPLTDLSGYKVYFGPDPDEFDEDDVVILPLGHKDLVCERTKAGTGREKNGTVCTARVRVEGQHPRYFAVSAYNKKGSESDLSDSVKK